MSLVLLESPKKKLSGKLTAVRGPYLNLTIEEGYNLFILFYFFVERKDLILVYLDKSESGQSDVFPFRITGHQEFYRATLFLFGLV